MESLVHYDLIMFVCGGCRCGFGCLLCVGLFYFVLDWNDLAVYFGLFYIKLVGRVVVFIVFNVV